MSNRGRRDVTPGLPDLGTTRDERAQQWCQYRAGEPGDAAVVLKVDKEDPERPTMTSADDRGVDARTAMKTTKAAKLRSEGTTQLQLNRRESTGDETMLRRAPLSITTTSGDRPQVATLQPKGADAAAT
uniref:Uncharacterized protein n=1 Tax=Oryza punctata TaxID=4537 RepID=A0A0E0JHA1_ORYPU